MSASSSASAASAASAAASAPALPPRLDRVFHRVSSNVAQQDSVIGVCVADTQGLCVHAQGIFRQASAAHVHSMLENAVQLSFDGEQPVVSLQTEQTHILFAHSDGYTTAIAKDQRFSLPALAAAATTTTATTDAAAQSTDSSAAAE